MRAPFMIRLAIPVGALALAACETETASSAVVHDDYPAVSDGGDPSAEITVTKAWYASTLFLDPIAPGEVSAAQRVVKSTDYVYAILAPGWDPSSAAPPTQLIPVRSKGQLTVKRGDTLTISVTDATFDGRCGGGSALSQDDADFITQRIFPGDFANVAYDAKSCASTPIAADAGTIDAASDAVESGNGDDGASGG